MRSFLALVMLGVAAGACTAAFSRMGFSSWEVKVLPWVIGAIVWQARQRRRKEIGHARREGSVWTADRVEVRFQQSHVGFQSAAVWDVFEI